VSHSAEVYVIGAGGHAKVIIRALQELEHRVTMVFDDDLRLQGRSLLGIPIVGPIARIAERPPQPAVIAIGNNAARRRIAEQYDLPWMTVVHPRAFVDASVCPGRGTVVLAQAAIHVDARLGEHVIVNHAATVDHDCLVEDYAHLAPGVHLAGEVTVQAGVLLGIGAVVIPGTCIGRGTIVGAAAAVVCDLPKQVVAVGVPARIIRSRLDIVD
jgi:sugar O-acyltransferase (sialic acid O-acetyltransferase NeuD family)